MNKKRDMWAPFPPVGTIWREDFGHGPRHHTTRKVHILAHVEGQVVFKHWSYRARGWAYQITTPYWFNMLHKDGQLKELKK